MSVRVVIDLGSGKAKEESVRRLLRDALEEYAEQRTPVDRWVEENAAKGTPEATLAKRKADTVDMVLLAKRVARAADAATVQREETIE